MQIVPSFSQGEKSSVGQALLGDGVPCLDLDQRGKFRHWHRHRWGWMAVKGTGGGQRGDGGDPSGHHLRGEVGISGRGVGSSGSALKRHRLLLIRIEGNVVVLELLLVVVMMMGPDAARLLLGPAIHQDGLLTIA